MLLRGIRFAPIMNASGAQGFYGEGYPIHRHLKRFGLTFEGEDFNSKTATLGKRVGNMLLDETDQITPKEFKPKCIKVYFLSGKTVNAVSLSNPGLPWLLEQKKWQERQRQFSISVMTVASTPEGRVAEAKGIVREILKHKSDFQAPFMIELNRSCPNQKESGSDELVDETNTQLDILAELEVPISVKISVADVTPSRAVHLSNHSQCDALTVSNAIAFGKLPEKIRWGLHFPFGSPLAQYGGGALSGKPLFRIVQDWIKESREAGLRKPIWACGGIMCRRHIREMAWVDANGVQDGVVNILRWWRKRGMIEEAHTQFT